MENKTPMQELIEWIIKYEKVNKVFPSGQECMFQAELLEEKEEQLIIDAGNSCAIQQMILFDKVDKMTNEELEKLANRKTITLGQDYYNQKFRKDE